MPGDLVGGVALEIHVVELSPQRLLRLLRHGVKAQLPGGFSPSRFEAVVELRRARSRAQLRLGRMEQLLEQLRLPGVPDLRTRSADIGDGEKVQRGEPAL